MHQKHQITSTIIRDFVYFLFRSINIAFRQCIGREEKTGARNGTLLCKTQLIKKSTLFNWKNVFDYLSLVS